MDDSILDFSNQDLQNRSFQGRDLTSADFNHADLRGCDFTGAILTGAKFDRARMGQSQRQTSRLVANAIVGPFVVIGGCLLFANVITTLLPENMLKVFWGILPFLAVIFEVFFHSRNSSDATRGASFMDMTTLGVLLGAMVAVTGALLMGSVSGFGDGAIGLGLFLLILVGISAIVTYRIFTWLTRAIESNPGTSFKKANLTEADFAHAQIENTDFSFAVLTGACWFKCQINSHTHFTNTYCEYLYLEPLQQSRKPEQGTFQVNEAEQFLTRLKMKPTTL